MSIICLVLVFIVLIASFVRNSLDKIYQYKKGGTVTIIQYHFKKLKQELCTVSPKIMVFFFFAKDYVTTLQLFTVFCSVLN